MSLVDIWEESSLGTTVGPVQTPELEVCLISSSSRKKASMDKTEGASGESD